MNLRRVGRLLVLAIVAATSTVGVAAMPAGAGPAPNPSPINTQGPPPGSFPNTLKIVNVATGLCAAPAGGSAAINDVVVEYYCDADPTRLWNTAVRGDGFQELYNASTGLCLSPAGGSTAVGALIVQYYCDNDPARGWTTYFDPNTGTHIMNEHSGLCLSLGAGAGLNAALLQTTCDNAGPSGWFFSYGDYIRNVNSQMCMYSKPGGLNDTVRQTYCGDPYRLTIDSTGRYIVEDMLNGLCLSPAGGSTVKNTSIVEYYCDADPSRHWTLTWSNGTYAIRNVKSNMCLSPAGGGTAQATVIVQYSCDGDPSRLWTIMAA